MDIHSTFDEYLDLRDQQEEGHLHPEEKTQPAESVQEQTAASATNEATSSPATVPTWNIPASEAANLVPEHSTNGTASATVDPSQPFYFPLDGTGWASVFAASEMNTAALTAFMNEGPAPNTDNDNAAAAQSHFIPPQQMLLQPSFVQADKEKEEEKEQDTGRMKTRSSTRRRAGRATSEETTTEAPKKKKGKKLYCVCQKPYTGEPMVQCDRCEEWFHCACVDLDPDEAEDIDTWVCKSCEAKEPAAPESAEPPATTPEEPAPSKTEESERPYATRQARARKCLYPPCPNRTRADSYCSDVCASQDSMRKTGDTEYVPAKSPERRPKTDKKPIVKPQQEVVAPEDDPIRKNVVKNMSTILKSIIASALDKDPSLFSGASLDPAQMADHLAQSIEDAMFKGLADQDTKRCGDQYKTKFRSLLHNLKDKANQAFQLSVVKGELTPDKLVKMSSEDMANPELKSRSLSMREESIKNSVLKRSNVPIIKKTHKGDIIMIGTPDRDDHHPPLTREKPRWINTASTDDAESRKSSFSETPTTPVAISRDQRQDDQRFEDILARIGIGNRDDNASSNKRGASPFEDRPKKRKVEIDMEKLLGDEEEFKLEFGSDAEEPEERSGTPPLPPPVPQQPTGPPKPPTIWRGRVNMPQVSEFEASARQIGGRTLSESEWADVLSPTMWIEGRIPVDRVTQYVTQTQYATSREIVLLEIEATGPASFQNARTLLEYFATRQRYGVVGHNKTKIKDFYLIPLYKTQQLPDCLYVVRIEETQRDADMFLGVLVIHKQQERPSLPLYQQQPVHHSAAYYPQ
ncbi:transcription factor S-II, central domain-containing protein [Fennellomyces sp. T-0311]|nr:transcription factor S-II, central domain-containing protein [Fennellomyces sp. T-0311]